MFCVFLRQERPDQWTCWESDNHLSSALANSTMASESLQLNHFRTWRQTEVLVSYDRSFPERDSKIHIRMRWAGGGAQISLQTVAESCTAPLPIVCRVHDVRFITDCLLHQRDSMMGLPSFPTESRTRPADSHSSGSLRLLRPTIAFSTRSSAASDNPAGCYLTTPSPHHSTEQRVRRTR